ncbi:hypothetical protein SGRIM128S_04659 [Streptomyces griseomycini]
MPMVDAHFFNDEPFLNDEGPDLLGREQYAQHAVELLGRVRAQTETGVLALIGPWGSGKSFVLGKVIRLLQSRDGHDTWLIAELNPWLYSDLESLTAALFSEIRAALPKGERWSEVRQKIGGFGQAISPLGKLTALAGLDSEGLIRNLQQLHQREHQRLGRQAEGRNQIAGRQTSSCSGPSITWTIWTALRLLGFSLPWAAIY